MDKNPLSDLITDETFALLDANGIFNKIGIRNYQIRKKYKEMKENNINTWDIFDAIKEDYPYLEVDSIRKIIYDRPK